MKYLGLVWSNLKRKKLRTTLTIFSILVAFLLFGYLSAIRQAFSMGVEVAGMDRLVVRHNQAAAAIHLGEPCHGMEHPADLERSHHLMDLRLEPDPGGAVRVVQRHERRGDDYVPQELGRGLDLVQRGRQHRCGFLHRLPARAGR